MLLVIKDKFEPKQSLYQMLWCLQYKDFILFKKHHNDITTWKISYGQVHYQGSNWQEVSIGSGSGLVLYRQQVWTLIKADPIHSLIYASPGACPIDDIMMT